MNRENSLGYFLKGSTMIDWKTVKDEELVCYCKSVSKSTIVNAIKEGHDTLARIQEVTGACTGNKCKELNPSGKCCSGDIGLLIQIYSDGSKEGSSDCSCCCSQDS